MKSRLPLTLLTSLLAVSLFAQTPAPSVVTGEDWSFPASASVAPAAYSGIFNGAVDSTYKIANVAHTYRWSQLNPTNPNNPNAGTFNFTALENALHAAYIASPRYLIIARIEASLYREGGIVGNGQAIPQWVVNKYSLDPTH